MKNEEFQKLLNAPFPIEIPSHEGKIFMSNFFKRITVLVPFSHSFFTVVVQLLSLILNRNLAANKNISCEEEIVLIVDGIETRVKKNSSDIKKIVLTVDGFDAETILEGYFVRYYWNKVSEFKLGNNGFVFFFADKEAYEKKSMFQKFLGQHSSIRNKYAIKTKQLVELLNHCRNRVLAESVA